MGERAADDPLEALGGLGRELHAGRERGCQLLEVGKQLAPELADLAAALLDRALHLAQFEHGEEQVLDSGELMPAELRLVNGFGDGFLQFF